jgi:hypothetical protein
MLSARLGLTLETSKFKSNEDGGWAVASIASIAAGESEDRTTGGYTQL